MPAPVVQHCPVCNTKYDVGIYVSGQRVKCRRCGNKFVVQRNDTFVGAPGGTPIPGKPPAPGEALREPVKGPGRGAAPVEPPRVPASPDPRAVDAKAAAAAAAAAAPPPGTVRRDRVPPDKELPVGTVLGGYELSEPLGKGAMGTVYRARQVSLDRTVAVKLMASDLVGQREFVLRFRREAAALAALSHRNIVQIIDQANVGGYYFFVMEFIEGPTLRRELARRALTYEAAMDLIIQVGRGLAYAHSKGIVHRDLKPENVLIAETDTGRVAKICDFGLADILFSDRSYVNLTGSRISMGTVNYMAPEQRQDAGRVDQRADIFSYGVVAYELLTYELPIGRFPPASARNAKVDPALDDVIHRALDQDQRNRFRSVKEMLDRFEAYAQRPRQA
jgi:serine/threonine-protein kinase